MKYLKIYLYIFVAIILLIIGFVFYRFQRRPEIKSSLSINDQEMECLRLGSDYARKKCESLIKKPYIYLNRDGTVHQGVEGDGYQDLTLSLGVSHLTYADCKNGEPSSQIEAALCGKSVIDIPYFVGESEYAKNLSKRLSSGNGFFINQEEYNNLVLNHILQ